MCGRFALTTPIADLSDLMGFPERPNLEERYNICPTQPIAVVVLGKNARKHFTLHRWGLIPNWVKEPDINKPIHNARSETVNEKPSFRGPFRGRRCLIPANGFYEWQSGQQGKQPYYISRPDNAPFAFAGIWDDWLGADGSEVQSCAILTTEAGHDICHIHHRMPVILQRADYDNWLYKGGHSLLKPAPINSLKATAVSSYMNSTRNQGPACLTPEPVQAVLF
ncbi:SOS response-associated peptidase [Kiloniella laminariae]|uniref:Abasic site processing protein n=1 Tax=Kiloniella laminariae TaxID=454162 RepID=A0ABT4LJE4_9PROT|nr:SOS response-associated peptidase [Kiloniella laminariae]MCZ4281055.1 SOS response-associated peptidase [Kiloniella laminariae]